MPVLTALRLLVAVSGLLCLLSLMALLFRTFAKGGKQTYARPRASTGAGIRYALGRGMLPWEKESTAHHLPTYLAGIAYHAGIFVAFGLLATTWIDYSLPAAVVQAVRIVLLGGLVAGIAMLLKRVTRPPMRAISCADDYVANLLLDLFLLAALGASFAEALLIPFFAVASLTLIYVPLGKVRHCVFFFYSRVLFGSFFGRRGALPHSAEGS